MNVLWLLVPAVAIGIALVLLGRRRSKQRKEREGRSASRNTDVRTQGSASEREGQEALPPGRVRDAAPSDWDATGYPAPAPAPAPPPAPAPARRQHAEADEPASHGSDGGVVEVFYATDRAQRGIVPLPDVERETYMSFGGQRDPEGEVHFGRCFVSVPEDHRIGRIERPASIFGFSLAQDPARHVMIVRAQSMSRAEAVGELSRADTLVFIHGYNVAFEEAIRRTAQLKYDLAFAGHAVTYSWPSVATFRGYLVDGNNAQWSVPHLAAFLSELAAQNRKVHLIAHSMGNRVLLGALERVLGGDGSRVFSQVMMAAPDVDADVFKDLTSAIGPRVSRMTLYASSNDEALAASAKFQGGYVRAGQTIPSVTIAPPVDTIDASAVATGLVGHSYYGDNRSVVSDMYELLRWNRAPSQRFGMRPMDLDGLRYFAFKP